MPLIQQPGVNWMRQLGPDPRQDLLKKYTTAWWTKFRCMQVCESRYWRRQRRLWRHSVRLQLIVTWPARAPRMERAAAFLRDFMAPPASRLRSCRTCGEGGLCESYYLEVVVKHKLDGTC